jgi:putative endonuclease
MNTYHVYILRCSDNTFYTGITGNFDQRWVHHHQGYFKTCYTFKRRPLKIEYFLEFTDVIQAILFEKRIKGWTKAKKQALINRDFDKIQLLAECRNYTHSKFKPDGIP